MGGKRILTDAQLDEMAQMREDDHTYKEIAEHFGVSQGAIKYQCVRLGVEPSDPDNRSRSGKTANRPASYLRNGVRVRSFTEAEDAKLREWDEEGLNYAEMGRRLDPPRKPHSVQARMMTLARLDALREGGADV